MQMVNKLQIISILDDDNLGRPDLILDNTNSIIDDNLEANNMVAY